MAEFSTWDGMGCLTCKANEDELGLVEEAGRGVRRSIDPTPSIQRECVRFARGHNPASAQC